MLGNAQLLRDYTSPLTFEGRRQVAAIASAAERARHRSHISDAQPSERIGEKHLVDVVDVIRSVEHLKSTELKSYGISVGLELPPSLTIMGRYTLLQEVFLNLLDNARDAIRQAGRDHGIILINGRIIRPDTIRVDVSDNGTGILRENRDRIFDPFFTPRISDREPDSASIVHSIVNDHGGRIFQVASDGESFTRFEIEFPTRLPIASSVAPLPQANNVLRILAVDDEPEMLSILENSLEQMGHHVECTTTGSRALQLLSKNKFDVLLLDMHLPEMDGKSIVTRLQTMIPPVSVRTIVITGDSIRKIRKFAEEHSFRGHETRRFRQTERIAAGLLRIRDGRRSTRDSLRAFRVASERKEWAGRCVRYSFTKSYMRLQPFAAGMPSQPIACSTGCALLGHF